jgi:hypothetical protein
MTPEQARLGALSRFAVAITILNVLGHTVLGFEVSVVQTLVSAATGYAAEIAFEAVGAWGEKRRPRYAGGFKSLVIFLLPAHITSLATSMFLYAGDRLMPFIFAVVLAIASKSIFTVSIAGQPRHFLNPSNTGLVATFALFPTVGMIPYHFTTELYGYADWVLPALIICTGSFLNARFTKRVPLILAWLGAFILQAVVRDVFFSAQLLASLAQMTGVSFLLFTFYMITDPQTSPSTTRGQVIFGCAIGAVYGIFVALHLVYMIFGALLVVCIGRGLVLWLHELARGGLAPDVGERLLGILGRPSRRSRPASE